jgi:hypothetical protein
MASVVGTIRSAGQGVSGLLVKAFEEVRVGVDPEDGKPCRLGNPETRQIGQATTNAAGAFSIAYDARQPDDDACSFQAFVRITVFDGATLVLHTPKKIRATTTRFDLDLVPPPPPPEEGQTARIVGVLTRCGAPATGHRVVAFESVTIGVVDPPRPCRQLGAPRVRRVGAAVVDGEGRFEIRYAPTPVLDDETVCSFTQKVQLTAFDSAVVVWQSPERNFAPTVRFDHELHPGCVPGSTLVRVVDTAGRRVAGAEVFADGASRGLTDAVGQLFVPGVRVGSTLVARLRVHEQETERARHNVDSDRNWNYRVYVTSMTLRHDARGNAPAFDLHPVSNPQAVQDLVIRPSNTLIGFNLLVSVEWDAPAAQLLMFRDRFLEASELLFNATDGQFLIERVSVLDNGRGWNEADFRIHANRNQNSNATVGGIDGKSGVINMNPYDMLFPGVLLHEFGHYGFACRDEYKPADCWPDGQPVMCTLGAAPDPPTEFSEGGTKDACFLRGAQFTCRKKLCSSHPANPHARCTAQGDADCWSVVAQRFGGRPEWRIITPVTRGVIVDRLPDSGVPLETNSTPHASSDPVESYIPIAAWKPSWHVRLVTKPDECPNLIVRVTHDGVRIDNAQVTVQTSDGRTLLQGRTAALSYPDGVVTGPGEIPVRGAHVGDSVSAVGHVDGRLVGRFARVTSCASPIVVELPEPSFFGPTLDLGSRLEEAAGVALRVGPTPSEPRPPLVVSVWHEGAAEPFVVDAAQVAGPRGDELLLGSDEDQSVHLHVTGFDAHGNALAMRSSIAQRVLLVDDRHVVASALGDVELVLPRGAVDYPARVLIEDALDIAPPHLGPGDELLVAPQRVTCSYGERLRAPAMLHMNVALPGADDAGVYASTVELVSCDEDGRTWRPIAARIHPRPLTASAAIDRLGIFALVRRRPK